MTKQILLVLTFLAIGYTVDAQSFESPQLAFNQAANQYIFSHVDQAVNTLNLALKDYPDDQKLRDLLDKILKDRKKQQQQKQQNKDQQQQKQEQNQQQQDQQKQDQQQNQQQKQEQQDQKESQQEQQQQEQSDQEKENAEEQQKQQKESGKSDEEKKKEGDESMQLEQSDKKDENKDDKELPHVEKNLEQLNISPEKARMILEAMKNNEVQYIQQMQRKPTQRPDSDKPDW